MNSMYKLMAFTFAFILTINVKSQDVISVNDAANLINDKNTTVIVDCRKEALYKTRHIKNAVHIDHNDLYKPNGIKSMLKTPQEIAAILGKASISNDKKIILYDDGSGKYAGRMYWILKYLGANDVRILDGHIKGWQARRKQVTMAATMAKKESFVPKVKPNYLATIADVKNAINSEKSILIDVRSAEEYKGTDDSELRKGHIPGAINLEFNAVIGTRDELKSKEELKSLVESAGISADKEIILYCASSVRAWIVFLALNSVLNYPNVKVYDGAFYEWEADKNNTVQK